MEQQARIFNALPTRRYALTVTDNGSQATPFRTGYTSSNLELTVNITYEELCAHLQAHFGISNDKQSDPASKSSIQQYRNVVSTLNSFLASLGKTLQSRVGVELGSAFDEKLRQYIDVIDVAPRTRRDRIHHVKLIRRVCDAARKTATGGEPTPTLLSTALRAAVARTGLAPKTLAREIGVNICALRRWLNGSQPNRRGFPTLRRLEKALDLPRDQLVALVKEEQGPAQQPPHQIAFRQLQRERVLSTYVLPEASMLPGLLQQWRAFFDYKTTVITSLKRAKDAKWRGVPLDTLGAISKLAQRGSSGYPTADIVLQKLRQFIGFMSLPIDSGGWGLAAEEAQTMAWLANPEAVNAFLQFMTDRSGGLKHGGQASFCALVAALVREKTGYLRQRPELAKSLPPANRPEDAVAWQQQCELTFEVVTVWKGESRDMSRRPREPIAHLLDLEDPLTPVLEAIAAIERAATKYPTGSVGEALLMRDACLLALLVSNPLRIRNWRAMTWRPDNTGNLYQAGDGWHIRFAGDEFKNGKGNDTGSYDVTVPAWVVPKLAAYLEEYRATLLRGRSSKFLFVSSRSQGAWNGIDRRVAKLTARFLAGSPGIGPHAFRHLVATTLLREKPGAFKAAGHLLNDKPETVQRVYTHVDREDSFAQHEAHINRLLQKLGQRA